MISFLVNKEGALLRRWTFQLAVLVAGISLAQPVQAQDRPVHAEDFKATDKTISLDVTDAYLEDVLKLLSKQAGINFVASEDARNKRITVKTK